MFNCGVCGKTSEPRERIGGRVPTKVRDVEYVTPIQTTTGFVVSRKITHGTEVVEEVMACAKCAASPLPPTGVGGEPITREQPAVVIAPRRDQHKGEDPLTRFYPPE